MRLHEKGHFFSRHILYSNLEPRERLKVPQSQGFHLGVDGLYILGPSGTGADTRKAAHKAIAYGSRASSSSQSIFACLQPHVKSSAQGVPSSCELELPVLEAFGQAKTAWVDARLARQALRQDSAARSKCQSALPRLSLAHIIGRLPTPLPWTPLPWIGSFRDILSRTPHDGYRRSWGSRTEKHGPLRWNDILRHSSSKPFCNQPEKTLPGLRLQVQHFLQNKIDNPDVFHEPTRD